MNSFLITLIQVAIMLAYCVPGIVFVKCKMVKEESISSFAKVLMYFYQPCLTIYAFNNADYSVELLKNSGLVFIISITLMLAVLFAFSFILRKKSEQVEYRVFNVATCFGNCMFMGIPILTALYPNNPEVTVYSAAFFIAMNLLGWSVASAIITRDKKYISVRKILLNPAVIGVALALPLFCTGTKLPTVVGDTFTLLGKMSTPLCMLIMGMRLGTTISFKDLLLPLKQYIFIAIKMIGFPLLSFAVLYFLPILPIAKASIFIMCCCPIASVVQTFSEMLNEGQKTAANLVGISTVLSILTIPLMSLCLPFIG